jgi:putative ABC transport system permease protein
MKIYDLALKNISGSAFRSWVVALCALLVASLALVTTLIMRGADQSLRLAIDRLGADIVVVPEGTVTKVESALLMGTPTQVWMSAGNLDKIAAVEGVAKVSPQLFLNTLTNAACCSVEDMFLIAYDPDTDFTLRPWLEENVGHGLDLGEAIGGTYVFVPEDEQNILLYGYFITLKGNMEPTGTGLDQSMFLTFETAEDISRISYSMAEEPLVIPENQISAVLVRLEQGENPLDVSLRIMHDVPGVMPIESPNLFRSYQFQLKALRAGVIAVTGIILALSVLLIGLVFSMAANERRRELGVLRAMGATRTFVFQSLISEAGILALAGGAAGIGLTVFVVVLFRNLIMKILGIPFLLPTFPTLLVQVGAGLGLALVSVTLAAMLPAYRISHMDPANAMRE